MSNVPWKADKNTEKKVKKIFFKKTFQKACQKEKTLLLLHPLIERLAQKKVRHVPRHIELTAVPMQIGTIIKESKRIGRFKKPLEFESNNKTSRKT